MIDNILHTYIIYRMCGYTFIIRKISFSLGLNFLEGKSLYNRIKINYNDNYLTCFHIHTKPKNIGK